MPRNLINDTKRISPTKPSPPKISQSLQYKSPQPTQHTSYTHSTPAPVSAPSFTQTIKDGIGYGIGSSIGHRITNFFLGPPSQQHQSPQPTLTPYEKCLLENKDMPMACDTLKPLQ